MNEHNVSKVSAIDTQHAAGIVVIGAVVALVLIRRGFRGVSVGGVAVGVS